MDMIELYAKEYRENDWIDFADCFEDGLMGDRWIVNMKKIDQYSYMWKEEKENYVLLDYEGEIDIFF